MATTSKGIIYPIASDQITPLQTHFANLANSTNTALGAINAGTDIPTGTLAVARGGTGHAGGSIPANAEVAGKNVLLNGDFTIWQRSSTFNNPTNGAYTSDRWMVQHAEVGASTRTVSRVAFTLGSAPVTGVEYTNYLRYAISAIGATNTRNSLLQKVEEVRTFANQSVTYSFWAKADSATGRTISLNIVQGFGRTNGVQVTPAQTVTAVSGSWYKDGVFVSTGTSVTLGTSFARYSISFNIPTIAGVVLGTDVNSTDLTIRMDMSTGITMTYDFFGVQLESGSVLTNFGISNTSLAAELLACQRFCYKYLAYNNAGLAVAGAPIATSGYYLNTTDAYGVMSFPTIMRSNPSWTVNGTTWIAVYSGSTVKNSTVIVVNNTSRTGVTIKATTAAATLGAAGWMETNNTQIGYILFEAELP